MQLTWIKIPDLVKFVTFQVEGSAHDLFASK